MSPGRSPVTTSQQLAQRAIRTRHGLLQRLLRFHPSQAKPVQSSQHNQQPFVPRLRLLEPRIVLNATAELSAAAGLVIFGDTSDDFVSMTQSASGNEIQLFDRVGNVIEIAGHASGASGQPTDPLAIADIPGGRVTIDLGAGNDQISLELPDAIDLNIVGGDGDDHVAIDVQPNSTPSPASTLTIESETIDLTPSNRVIQFADRDVSLVGEVHFGSLAIPATQIEVGNGTLDIDGSIVVGGTLRITATGGDVDWSEASVSTTAPGTDIFFDMNSQTGNSQNGSDVRLGEFNDAAGEKLDDVRVSGADAFELTNNFSIENRLIVVASTDIQLGSPNDIPNAASIEADSISVRGGNVDVTSRLISRSGATILTATGDLSLLAHIDSTAAGSSGDITLGGTTVTLSNAAISTSGGAVLLRGPTSVDGDVSLATEGGDVQFFGRVSAIGNASLPNHSLTIDTLLAGQPSGNVQFDADIQGTLLQTVEIDAGAIRTQSVSVQENLRWTAGSIDVFGSELITLDSGSSIQINGPIVFHALNTNVNSSGDVFLTDQVSATPGANLLVQADESIQISGRVSVGDSLSLIAGSVVQLDGAVTDWDSVSVSAPQEIRYNAVELQANNEIAFNSSVTFLQSTSIAAQQIQFVDQIIVDQAQTVTVDAELMDAGPQRQLEKRGLGELVLLGDSDVSSDVIISEGTLRLDDRLGSGTDMLVMPGGTLTGVGEVAGNVVVRGGVIDPASSSSTVTTGPLGVGTIEFNDESILKIDVTGTADTHQVDRLVVAGELIELSNSRLSINADAAIAPDTELLIVQNDSDGDVSGRFRYGFAEDGSPLAEPRLLEEGAMVAERFGVSAAAGPAFITYFGGDGNDITIVSAGDHVETVGRVTMVSRRGDNLEIRSGSNLIAAMDASPTIRPISGLNENVLDIDASVSGSELFVDINGFVDSSPNFLHFDADIVFDASSTGETASLTLFDSDPSSDDAPETLLAMYQTAADMQIELDHDNNSGSPDHTISARGLSQAVVNLQLESLDITTSQANDNIIVSRQLDSGLDGNPDGDRSVLGVSSESISSELNFLHPSNLFRLDGSGGDDQILVHSFGESFAAIPLVLGGAGNDQLTWQADATVGTPAQSQNAVTDDVELRFESILITGDITNHSGSDILIDAENSLSVFSLIDADMGMIAIESNAAVSELTGSTLRSVNADQAITLSGGDFVVGSMDASLGTIAFGSTSPAQTIGSLSQSLESQIVSDRLTVNGVGSLTLDSHSNDWNEVKIQADGPVTVFDSIGSLTLSAISTADILVRSAGDATLDSIETQASTARVFAAGSIIAGDASTAGNLNANVVDLRTAVPFLSQGNLTNNVNAIGQINRPLQVYASESFSADARGSIFVSSPNPNATQLTGHLPIGLVTSRDGIIQIDAVAIDDAENSSSVDIAAREITLQANAGIGQMAAITVSDLELLNATSEFNSISIDVQANRNVLLQQIQTGGGPDSVIDIRHSGEDRLSIGQIINQNGDVRVTTATASVDVLTHLQSDAIAAGGQGQVLITTDGPNSDVTIRGTIATQNGDIAIAATRNLVLLPLGEITSTQGAISLDAGVGGAVPMAAIDLQDGSVIDAGEGPVRLMAAGNIFISSVTSRTPEMAIDIRSEFGALLDSGDGAVDVFAPNGLTEISTAIGIGADNAIEVELDRLIATVRETGGIDFHEQTDIVLQSVTNNDGPIRVIAGGQLVATRAESKNTSETDVLENSRDVFLQTLESDADLIIGQVIASNGADVSLVAADDVLANQDDQIATVNVVADDLRIVAENQTSDGEIAIQLTTDLHDLELAVLADHRGDAIINDVGSLRLSASDRNDDLEQLRTSNGTINIRSEEAIKIFDTGGQDDGTDLRLDPEIVAGGVSGRISLAATESIEMGDNVQISASRSDIAAVQVASRDIILGNQFQIDTGSSVGVARQFAPRPEFGVTETAFYDATTITVNRLEQAAVNDATGILTVKIGNPGERGLTINLDWGSPSNRFQQIDDLTGDAPPLSVEHLYLEQDILSSTLNGRASSTAPLEVRFSVRHHESILVTGQTIQQASSDREIVAGELVSSTDNPTTRESPVAPILENGETRFIIPALSIPVAFFPVRDVIPVLEDTAFMIKQDNNTVVFNTTTTTTEAASASSTGREEFFQIRVRSPDPSGDDLAPPARLPDDIISGDQLKTLFNSLPDGKYEIQYVLGDGNIRSILTVELRDGEPIVPDGDSEGGQLQLKPIDVPTSHDNIDEGGDEKESDDKSSDLGFSTAERFLARQRIDGNDISEATAE